MSTTNSNGEISVSLDDYSRMRKELERLWLLEKQMRLTQQQQQETTSPTTPNITMNEMISPTTTNATQLSFNKFNQTDAGSGGAAVDDVFNDDELSAEERLELQKKFLVEPSSTVSSVYGSVTEEQKRIKLENVINSFNRRGWAYLSAPTHPDDNDYNPIQIAFILANESISKFIVCKCVEYERWDLLLPGGSEKQIAPFDLALDAGHLDFVRDMLNWLRSQMQLVAQKDALAPQVTRRDRHMSMAYGESPRGLGRKTGSGGGLKPPKDDDFASPLRSPSNRIRSQTLLARSASVASLPSVKSDSGSDTTTSTEIFEDFDQLGTLGDDDSLDDDNSEVEKDTKDSVETSTNRESTRYDETQYNLHQYDELLHSQKIISDPLFSDAFSPRHKQLAEPSSPITAEKESSYLTDCKVTKKANVFKPAVYFTETSDHEEENEEKLIYSNLFEQNELTVPNHVKQCISTMCDDFVVFEQSSTVQLTQTNRKKLHEVLYEIDVKEMPPKKRKVLLSQKPKMNLFSKEPVEEVKIEPMDADSDLVNKFIAQEHDSVEKKNFILEALEDIQPVQEMKKSLGVDIEEPDILLSDFELREEIITSSTDILFTPKALEMNLFEKYSPIPFEEVLCSVTLYEALQDGSEFLKSTETFTFSFTEHDADVSQQKALFNVEGVTDKTFALLKMFRRFKGEHSETLNELYVKGDKAKDKEIASIKPKISKFEVFENVYSYFCWTAVAVRAHSNGELVDLPLFSLPTKPGDVMDKTLLLQFIHPETRKHKSIPGTVTLTLKEISVSPVPRHFIPTTNQMVIKLDNNHVPVSRMKSLEYVDTKILDIENTYLVYPLSVTNLKKDVKNIQVVVSLCSADSDIDHAGLKVVYPLKTNSTMNLGTEGYSFVSQSNHSPDFTQEIKLQIPSQLTPEHHLLFKFYSITHKENLIQKVGHRSLVGYSFVKILDETKLQDGVIDLPVYAYKASGKTANYMRGVEAKLEGASFKLKLIARSVSHPTGSVGNLDKFFAFVNTIPNYYNVNREMLEAAVGGLNDTPIHLSSFAPMVFTQLFQIIEQNPGLEGLEVRITAFRAIMRLVDKYRNENPAMVLAFVKYHFNHANICEPLLKPMQLHFETENVSDQKTLMRNSWFVFSVLLKSMVLHVDLKRNKENNADFDFSATFKEALSDFVVRSVGKYIKKKMEKEPLLTTYLVSGIGSFVSKMLSITSKSFVLKLAARFNDMLNGITKPENSVLVATDMQLVFFKELFSYKQYVLLFLPQTPEEAMQITQDPTMLEEDLSVNTHNHFIYSAFVDTIIKCLYHSARNVRMKAITYLREFVYKTNWDERYQSPELKERINQVHFEFLNKFIDIMEEWKRISSEKKKKHSSSLASLRKKLIAVKNNISSKKLILDDIKKSKARSKDLLSRVQSEITELDKLEIQIEQLVQKEEVDLKAERPKVHEERRHLMAVIVHILKNMNSDVLLKWFTFNGTDPLKRILFLEILQSILSAFEFAGSMRMDALYNGIFKKKKAPTQSLVQLSSGWGIAEWGELEKSASLARMQKQVTRSMSIDSKSGEEKSKRNMLSFFNKSSVNYTAIMTLGLLGNSNTPPPAPKSSTSLSLTIPKETGAPKPIVQDLDAHRKVFVESKIMKEKHMSADAGFFILTCLIKLTERIQQEKQMKDKLRISNDGFDESDSAYKQLIEQLVRTFTFILHLNQCEKLLISLISYLRVFIMNNKQTLFSGSADLGAIFCESLMALCNSTVESVRQQSAATMYILARTAFFVSKGIHKPRIMITVALSRTLQRTVPEDAHLEKSIASLGILATLDEKFDAILTEELSIVSPYQPLPQEKWKLPQTIVANLEQRVLQLDREKLSQFKNNMQELYQQLQQLLNDTVSVNNTLAGKDPNQTEDLLYRISEFYEGIPELRFVWLRQLAQFHKQQGQYEESAQCYYRILGTVFTQLATAKHPLIESLPLDYFFSLSPYLTKMKNESKIRAQLLPQCSDFTEKGVINLLRTTIAALELAEQFEHAIPLLKILIPLFERSDDFANLSETHGSIRSMFEQINTSVQENSRIYSTYYRMYFYGSKWGPELDGKQYIYKMPKLFKLFKMKAKIAELFGDNVELITTPKKVDMGSLDQTKRHLQFTNVKPYIDDEDDDYDFENFEYGLDLFKKKKKTRFEQHMNLNKFYYETAFSKNSKKLSDKVTGIYKRKVILVVRDSFPDVKTRLPVVKELERILTPIESAIENIIAQTRKLEEVLEPLVPDISQLQLVLQGSVRAGVNGGPKDIVESFLAKSERFKYRKDHVQNLNDKCCFFLFICEQALRADSKHAKTNERAMHIELEKGFMETKTLLEQHLEKSSRADRMIQEYLQQDEKKNSTTFDPLKVETMEDVMQFNMNEYEMQTEDELDDLLRIPYNRNYKLSNTKDEKKMTMKEYLANDNMNDSDPETPV